MSVKHYELEEAWVLWRHSLKVIVGVVKPNIVEIRSRMHEAMDRICFFSRDYYQLLLILIPR